MASTKDPHWFICHIIRLALEGKKRDVAMLARRYARTLADRQEAARLCKTVSDAGYPSSILRSAQ